MNLTFLGRDAREWTSSLPIFVLLCGVIFLSIAENLNSQINRLGNDIWPDYHILRLDVPIPSCDPNLDIDAEVDSVVAAKKKELENDPFGGMFGDDEINPDAIRTSLTKQVDLCRQKHEAAQKTIAQKTDNVELFVSMDMLFSKLSQIKRENQQIILAFILFICAFTTTLTHHHISLRPMQSRMDFRVSIAAQIIANSALTYSAYCYLANGWSSGTVILNEHIRWTYLIGFACLTVISLVQFFFIPQRATPGGSPLKALLSIPLYSFMAMSSARFFFLEVENPQGMVLFVDKIMDTASMFIQVGLYIWVGMLLKQTFLGEYVFGIFKPWKLPPELLAFVAVVVMAVPTAYTGASGIIIIAMGAVVYTELRRVGARRQLALAATAMSGSLGVVLRPCLLVLLIAVLNKEVTTDMMYGWGIKVFLLTSTLFFLVSLVARQGPMKIAPVAEALPPSLQAFKPLLSYIAIFIVTAMLYAVLLDAHLDEHTAPIILPVIILVILMYERVFSKKAKAMVAEHAEERAPKFEGAIRQATTDTTVHIGALLMLMSLGLAVGGVIEDSGIFNEVTERSDFFSSQWAAMAALVMVLVAIGMFMDPFGAIILVSGTIAQAAYTQGIDPLHFWMITLVAFELGYLSPPVAVNHLLTRQVVGEEEIELAKEEVKGRHFWIRYERYLLPLTVLSISLIIVAFGPLIYKAYF